MADVEAPPVQEGAPTWMATFADMSTLLLTFFVLLLSFANMDVVKFKEMMGSVQEALGYQTVNYGNWNPEALSAEPKESSPNQASGSSSTSDPKLKKEIEKIVNEQELEKSVDIISSPRGVIIRVTDSLMFKPGSDKLMPNSFGFLDGVVQLSQKFPYSILVEGHTDDRPIRTRRFRSNWELSTARSIAVLRYLMEVGAVEAHRLGASGYAETRPLTTNKTPAGRNTNRRVEFVCYREMDALQPEPGEKESIDSEVRGEKPAAKGKRKKRRKGKGKRRRR